MSSSWLATPHDTAPAAALVALRDFQGPLLLDLDETLYLRNSTEDFIDSARPGLAAALLMQLLDWIQPWRWTGGPATRDAWRVRVVMVLFPWLPRQWQQRVPALAQRFANAPVVDALRGHHGVPIIVTSGFTSIVTPLVAALGFGASRIVAPHPAPFADRRRGKLAMALEALGADVVSRSLVITDSSDDLPLLEACARPLRTIWPGARWRAALSDVYLPGRYLSRIKRPGERYLIRGILQEDFAFWLIASLGLAPQPLTHVAGLSFLLLSFWAVYEVGYVDNDRVAQRHESDPKLSDAFHHAAVATPRAQPWIWALAAGAIAIELLRWPGSPAAADFAAWLAVLLGTQGWFWIYNRLDKPTRVWLYPGLQLARSAAFAVLVPVPVIGTLALGAHVLARWLPYYVYRFGGKDWPETPVPLTRLLFFVVLTALAALTLGTANVLGGTAAALLGWNLWRARVELGDTARRARRIDRAVS